MTAVLANVQLVSLAVAFSGTISVMVSAGTPLVSDYRPCLSNMPSISIAYSQSINIDHVQVVESDTTTATLFLEKAHRPRS